MTFTDGQELTRGGNLVENFDEGGRTHGSDLNISSLAVKKEINLEKDMGLHLIKRSQELSFGGKETHFSSIW